VTSEGLIDKLHKQYLRGYFLPQPVDLLLMVIVNPSTVRLPICQQTRLHRVPADAWKHPAPRPRTSCWWRNRRNDVKLSSSSCKAVADIAAANHIRASTHLATFSAVECKTDRSNDKRRQRQRQNMLTRQMSYRKEDRAMRPIYGCPEKFWESSVCTRLLFQKLVTDFCSDRY